MDLIVWVRNQWDRVAAWVLVTLGGLALVLGWLGVTDTPYTFEQIPFVISGGLGGLFLLGVGAMLWISADLRDEWRKLDALLRLHEERIDHDAEVDEGVAATAAPPGGNGRRRADARSSGARSRRAPLTGKRS